MRHALALPWLTAAVALASPAAAARAPVLVATTLLPPDRAKACLVDAILDSRMVWAQAIEHHDGWRVTFLWPSLGNYYVEVQPGAQGSRLEVYGDNGKVARQVEGPLSACAAIVANP